MMPNFYRGGVTDFSAGLRPQTAQPAPGPSGIMALLQRPGVNEGLLAFGLNMLASDKGRETTGQALARSLPAGMAAYDHGQRESAYNELLEGADPRTRALLQILGPERGSMLLAQQAMQPRSIGTLAKDAVAFDERTGEIVASNEGEEEFTRTTLADGTIGVFNEAQELVRVEGPAEDTSKEDEARAFSQTDQLADSFFQATTEDRQVAAAVGTAKAATDTAVGDQTRIIALNKLLDPTSIVKEGEFARVGGAGGFQERAQYYFNQLVNGRLPANLRREIDAEIDSQLNARRASFGQTLDRFRFRAEAAGLDPDKVTQDYYSVISAGPVDVDLRARYRLR